MVYGFMIKLHALLYYVRLTCVLAISLYATLSMKALVLDNKGYLRVYHWTSVQQDAIQRYWITLCPLSSRLSVHGSEEERKPWIEFLKPWHYQEFCGFFLPTASIGDPYQNETCWPLHFILIVKEQHNHQV